MKITATDEDRGERLDTVLVRHLEGRSRSQIKKWIEEGAVTVSHASKKGSYKVRSGDEIFVTIAPPREARAEPESIPLNIVYEDKDILVVNKEAGMVVHPAAGNPTGTLVNALLYHCRDLSGIGGVLRPGIVHRLDKGTSGLMVVAKNDQAHTHLSAQFKKREVKKIYLALVYGVPKKKHGLFDQPLGRHPSERKKISTKTKKGKESRTFWEMEESFGEVSLMRVKLETGRTHQIRVHFSSAGMPLIGDDLYGFGSKRLRVKALQEAASQASRPMLHAASLSFQHPKTGEKLSFKTEPPDDFRKILEVFRAVSS